LAVLPFALCLATLRLLLPPTLGIALGVVLGGGVLGIVYWCWVLPVGVKSWVERRVLWWTRTEPLVSR
jgi:CBS-domain-containing membrane protein